MQQRIDLNNIGAEVEIADLTVIILTFNEEKHIERCLKSAFQVARKVFVVDSFSTDRTVEIAEALGACAWQHEFRNHAVQFAWALESLPIDTDWVMRVDADECSMSECGKTILFLGRIEPKKGLMCCCAYSRARKSARSGRLMWSARPGRRLTCLG